MRHVVSDPDFLHGKPYLGGLRISLELIMQEFVQHKTIRDITRKYPQLSEEDVLFVLHYAIRLINAHPEEADIHRSADHS
jgi:uncharacterized protein (DUF433 family)